MAGWQEWNILVALAATFMVHPVLLAGPAWSFFLATPKLLSADRPPAAWIFAALSLAVFLCALGLISFALLQRQIQQLSAQVRKKETANNLVSEVEAQALLVRQMSMDLEELRKRFTPPSEPVQTISPVWTTSDLPVNLNRRGQIIRLSRKGKSVAEIAHDLHIAQGEVELLLKIHDLAPAKSDSAQPVNEQS